MKAWTTCVLLTGILPATPRTRLTILRSIYYISSVYRYSTIVQQTVLLAYIDELYHQWISQVVAI